MNSYISFSRLLNVLNIGLFLRNQLQAFNANCYLSDQLSYWLVYLFSLLQELRLLRTVHAIPDYSSTLLGHETLCDQSLYCRDRIGARVIGARQVNFRGVSGQPRWGGADTSSRSHRMIRLAASKFLDRPGRDGAITPVDPRGSLFRSGLSTRATF